MSRSGTPATVVQCGSVFQSKIVRVAQAAVLVMIISALLPAVAQAQPVPGPEMPMIFSVNNPCLAGEEVLVEGRQYSTIYGRPDQSGGFHATIRFVSKGKGVAVTSIFQPAKEYVFNSEAVIEMNAPSNGTIEQTTVLNYVLVRRAETNGEPLPSTPDGEILVGTGEDFMLKQTAHITWINGFPRVAFDKVRATCM